MRAGKAFQRFGRLAVRAVGRAHRRAGDFFYALLLHGIDVFQNDHGATRRAHDTHAAVFNGSLVQRSTEAGSQLGLLHGQKTGRQFFAADFKHKRCHDYFAPLSMG